MSPKFLWYIPNTVEPGHRGDDTTAGWGSVEYSTALAHAAEAHGWSGALLGTGWGRPDTFTVATALAARTTTFEPLIAVRPGYWQPAQFAGAAATLDQLSRGRALFNIVSGADDLGAYGDTTVEPARRYARTREFLYLLRRLWTEEDVTYSGEFFQVTGSTVAPRPYAAGGRTHPTLYFGGASPAAERVSAAEADVQLFWGEPHDGVARRIERLRALSGEVGRRHKPLEYGSPRWYVTPPRRRGRPPRRRSPPSPPPTEPPGQATRGRWDSGGSSTSPRGARSSTPASTRRRAGTGPPGRRPPGWSVHPATSPPPWRATASSASTTSFSPTPLTSRRSAGSATRCSPCCARGPGRARGAYGHRDSRRSGTPGKGSGTAASPRKADSRSGDGGDTVAASRSPIVRTS